MIEVKLPQTSEEIEESLVVFWHVQEGDQVEEGDTLVDIQTEKAVFEIAAESGGTIKEIKVKRGDSAKVGDILAVIEPAGTIGANDNLKSVLSLGQAKEETAEEKQSTFVRTSPRLRHLAKELGVDLATVRGTGLRGALTEEDIRKAAALESSSVVEGSREIKMSGIRRAIAKRMMESIHHSAQLTETAWADVTELSVLRKKTDIEISWNDLILFAVVKALQKHPALNAHIKDESIIQFDHVHLGIAVDTDKGLLVPVVRNANQLDVFELHTHVVQLAKQAKLGKLSHEELSGSTFTVTNLGAFGIQFFTPIINPPESAILGIGKIEHYLVFEEEKVVEKVRLPLSLTFDHRVIDGAPAARFLQTLSEILADSGQVLKGIKGN
ncbi:dihydrolipoamide acetyltransferase family protein [Tepidibacillus infernus]|uniref:Dihydrolipoamide acetyltransferase component of pyruvate dehydrogenase complex n=1 Tax=Tepidibacillus decaturensis TaxID=1413211 RepID=A0A135L1W5_9BACI|nr:dihydrolipoamide acetyltransferase family protein [Tepidibacillus decaturensis]KXG43001.1 hypothetical protein U473_02395 [Tepidibacillus decaturensis]